MKDCELFEYRCPYTDRVCYVWNCNECEVQAEEIEYMDNLEKGIEDDRSC